MNFQVPLWPCLLRWLRQYLFLQPFFSETVVTGDIWFIELKFTSGRLLQVQFQLETHTFWLIFCRQNSRTQTDLLFSVTKPIDSTYLWTESFTLTGDFLLFLLSFVQKLAPIQLVRPTLKSQENLLGEINGVQTKQTCERIFNFFSLSNRDVYFNCPVFCFYFPPLPAGWFAPHTWGAAEQCGASGSINSCLGKQT